MVITGWQDLVSHDFLTNDTLKSEALFGDCVRVCIVCMCNMLVHSELIS